MAKKLNTLELQTLPNLSTPSSGFVSLGAKSDGLYQKIGATEEKLATENDSSFIPLVVGTQTATTASWTGTLNAESLVSGQTIRYWLPRTSATNVTLNLTLKGGTTTGAIPVYYGSTTRLTTHYPAGSFIMLTYLKGALINGTAYTGWWAKANYADGTESYTVRWNAAIKAGAEITQYKLLVQGSDGRYYPTTIGNTTAGTKTISTVPFLIGSPIIFYLYTLTIAAGGVTSSSYNYTGVTTSTTTYAWNKVSGWRANEDVYLKGTVSGALFTLDNSTLTSHMTQDLPTTEDGFYYMRLGMFTNTTTGFRLSLQHPVYYFADGELQSLNTSNGADWNDIIDKPTTFTPSSHKHPTTDITGLGNIATINKNSSTSNYLRGDGSWVTPPNTTYSTATTSANGLMSAADKVKLNGIATGANNYVHPTSHSISFITGLQDALDGKSDTGHTHSYLPLSREYVDRRAIIPTSIPSRIIQFGFTSLNINSTSPYADFMDLGGYQDSSGGKKNLILFNKADFGIRQYQGTFGAASYSGYVDYFHTGNLTSLSQLTDNIGVATHIANTSNPHSVTKAQVGLGNVDNTADSAKNVLSATKLTTARTINGTSFNGSVNITTANWGTARTLSYTGDVTGSASVNGSANVATAMTLANSGVTAGTYRSVTVDAKGRVTAGTNPTTLAGYGITDFTSHNNSTPINSDNTTVNAIGYTNSVSLFGQIDGGLINIAYSATWQSQIFQDFRTGQIALRGKNNGTWTGWRTVLDSNNYNSYAPTKTGTGASGTWGINITGNAATATTATKLGTASVGSTQLPFYLNAGTATAITQANLRIGLFGATAIGSTTRPIYIAANGVPTAITGSIANSTTGSAATLTTTRTIWGQNFNGSANVTGALSGATTIAASSTITATGNILSSANVIANTGITIAQTSGTGMGISLYSTAGVDSSTNPTYGLMFASTASKGTHGAVTGSHATYFTMTNTAGRGWIFTTAPAATTGNVASISNTGVFTGSQFVATTKATSPVVDFGNNWTIEASGTELVFKYNGVTKQRFLSDGSIEATGEVTAFGSTV